MRPKQLVLAVLLAFTATVAGAQTARSTVDDQLKVVIATKADEGFTADAAALGRPTLLGVLEHEATVYLELTLDAGREYWIAGRCDSGCQDLNTRLLAPDFSPVTEDISDTDVPNLSVTPAESGPHLLAVQMTSCKEGICYFGIAIVSRPARR
jgi:hypothetical protein